jgi:hypothetical protein
LFGVSILTALTPTWAPLEVAFFMSANMGAQALYLRKMTQQPAHEAGSGIRPGTATTIKSEG